MIGQWLKRLGRSLASLRLAVVVLVLLAVVLAAATIYESKYGSEAVQRNIYGAIWFDLLLVLLGVNVAASAIVRWPWSGRLSGFVITHVSILLILGGCLTTNWLGVTGQVAIQEGGQDNAVIQDGWVIRAAGHGDNGMAEVQVPIQEPPKAPATLEFSLADQSYQLEILRYLPSVEATTQLVEGGPDDPAGILVEIQQPDVEDAHGGGKHSHSMQQWLLVDDSARWAMRVAGFSLTAASRYSPPAAPTTLPAKGVLVVTLDGQDHEVNVEQATAGPVSVGDGDTKVQVREYYDYATVMERGKLQEDPSKPVNPAVVVELTHAGRKERRIVFARYGDIRGMHGGTGGSAVRLTLRHAMAAEAGIKVVLVPEQDGWILYEQKEAQLVQKLPVVAGLPVTLQSMPISLVVSQQLAHARPGRIVTQAKADNNPQPAMEVVLKGPAGEQKEWLVWAQPSVFSAGNHAVQLTFQRRQITLPFVLRLDRFEIDQYPGTSTPAMYRSRLQVTDPRTDESRTAVIEMNRPLEYDGWSFFQSSYQVNGRQKVSILSASKDPGKPIVYWGSAMLVLGTVIIAVQRLKAQYRAAGKAVSAGTARTAQTGSKVVIGANNA